MFMQVEAIDEISLRHLSLKQRETQLRFMIVTGSMAIVRNLGKQPSYENNPRKTALMSQITKLLTTELYEMLDQILNIKIQQEHQIDPIAERELRDNIFKLLENISVQIESMYTNTIITGKGGAA